jgi:transposase
MVTERSPLRSQSKGAFSHHNLAENAIQPAAPGRKTGSIIGSKKASPRVAAFLSVVETCRRFDIPIRGYLGSVLPGQPIVQ